MQLERQLRPEAFGHRWEGGYITRRRAWGSLHLSAKITSRSVAACLEQSDHNI
jgi:hypothetical protein